MFAAFTFVFHMYSLGTCDSDVSDAASFSPYSLCWYFVLLLLHLMGHLKSNAAESSILLPASYPSVLQLPEKSN